MKGMKYPQLVSPRAVNAISDWLVSRLEQLGVESPQIYTRLLLSLLQSSAQVNDPIEFSNLEAFFANRKGGHKRFYLPSDAEALKKLNAVQCLREIVSNEQETATIEKLVDELGEKLKDIEKQTQSFSDEERFLIETHLTTDSILRNQPHTQLHQEQPTNSNNKNSHHHTRHHQHHQHQEQQQQYHQVAYICSNSSNALFTADSKHHNLLGSSTTEPDALNDLDNDPKKRYFRAFPALSKEMEESFRIWRRNAKSLTWPLVGRSVVANNINNSSVSLSSSSSSSIISSSNFGAKSLSTDKSVEKKLKGVVGHQSDSKLNINIPESSYRGDIGSSEVQQHQEAAASVKKKSKRRRNQALCKGKTIQNVRKLAVGPTSNSVGVNKYHHYTHYRNSSPAWDTDFKGCWEMGPDLIKDFIRRQNGNKRNRSNSESMEHDDHIEHKILIEMPAESYESPLMKGYIDLSFCCDDDDVEIINNQGEDTQPHYTEEGVDYVDEDYDANTFASVSELTTDNFNPKRLYQREGHTQKSLAFSGTVLVGYIAGDNSLDETAELVDPVDFQQFKAKFNSSVEALWKDVETTPNVSSQQNSLSSQIAENLSKVHNPSVGGISSAFYATTSLNALAPFKNDLWNFWSNYQQHNFDQITKKLSTTTSTSSMITTCLGDSSASSGAGADIANSSDYFSMPSNLDDFERSVGSVRRINETGASLGAHTPSINVFLQNSIWSTSGDGVDAIGTTSVATAADNDESFLFKVWHSNKKLSELDVDNAITGEKISTIVTDSDGGNNTDFNKSNKSSATMVNNSNIGANLQFPPYQNLKWSEGINAGPPYGSLCTPGNLSLQNEIHSLNKNSTLRAENNCTSFSSLASVSSATWEAPAYGQNAQPDLKSWCASNPMSLTEMYGTDVCDSIVNQSPVDEHEQNKSEMVMEPAVTLPNHCANTSGFIAYSRIKQCSLVQPQTKPLDASNAARLPKDFFRSSEEENLLTSERTHFHPIENFLDGHTFDISNALDPIEFERTASGLMCYESEEYLEYTRSDIYMADEEVATNSTNLLRYSKRPKEEKDDMFIIKFRVKRTGETACQTEEQDFHLAATKMAELSTSSTSLRNCPPSVEINNMFHNTFSLSRQANNEAIMAAVTKAVAAAAKAAADNHLNTNHFCWLPIANINTTTSDAGAIIRDTNPSWRPDNSVSDEVDFCEIDNSARRQQQQLVENWSMQEVEKQCHQRRCFPQQQQQQEIERKDPTTSNIDRNEENSLENTSLHTLWGMCAVCNSCEYGKSMPADRLLRDELKLEADEIMSDLRCMQDLYIGESDILNETNEAQSTGENELYVDDKMFDYFNKEMGIKSTNNPWNIDVTKNKGQRHDPGQVSMLQKVNQLIEDLLKPENTGTLSKDTVENDMLEKQTQSNNVWNLQSEQYKIKSLWQFAEQEDINIWKHKPLIKQVERTENNKNNEAFVKPMKLLKQVGSSLSEDLQYREILNWEHDHLAKIWQQTKPSSMQLNETFIKHHQNETSNNNINSDNFLKENKETLDGNQKLVEQKNLKNLQNTNNLTPPSTLPCNTYKKVQQFLNNTAAKMKLVANRKRRHSASQNFYQHQHVPYNNISNNNNNNNIADLNAYKQKLNDTLKASKEQQKQDQAQQEAPCYNYNTTLTKNANSEEQPTKQTIITCKYWTTATNGTQSSLDSAAAAMMLLAAATNANNTNDMLTITSTNNHDQENVLLDENIFGNTFSCLIDKNASILKHVTMMTRPLTR